MNNFDNFLFYSYSLDMSSNRHQTVQDIIATREMGFARNINICRGIQVAGKITLKPDIRIIPKPEEYYINVYIYENTEYYNYYRDDYINNIIEIINRYM